MSDLRNCCSKNIYPLQHGASFYPSLLSFYLQIVYRKVRNLQIGVDKLVGKVSINLLCHAEFITSHKVSACVISILIKVPAVAMPTPIVSCKCKQIDLTSNFVTIVALLCKHVIVNKCK